MKVLVMLGLIMLTGCQKWDLKTYKLSNGDKVKCGEAQESKCGITLVECEDGKVYLCQKNLTIITK